MKLQTVRTPHTESEKQGGTNSRAGSKDRMPSGSEHCGCCGSFWDPSSPRTWSEHHTIRKKAHVFYLPQEPPPHPGFIQPRSQEAIGKKIPGHPENNLLQLLSPGGTQYAKETGHINSFLNNSHTQRYPLLPVWMII